MVGIASAATHAYRNNWIVLFRNQNIKEWYLDDSDILFIDEDYEKSHKNKRLIWGDILVARTWYPWVACVVPDKYKNSQSFTTLIIRPKHSVIDTWYLCYYINSEIGQSFFEINQIWGGQKNVNAWTLEKMLIPLPSQKEQERIVKIFSKWDEAISKVSKLIGQHELRKKWLIQKLLSGKVKLKWFTQKWQYVELKELFDEITEINDWWDWHTIMTISAKSWFISQDDKFDRVIAWDSLKKYTQLKNGDFAYNKWNSKSYEMGCIYQLKAYQSALVPFVYICFRPKNIIDDSFYRHWFLSHWLDRQLKWIITSWARWDGLLNVNTTDFFNLKVPFPIIAEQKEIGIILNDSDIEINLLKSKLEKLKEQKKWLMQQLLMGKKRLKF